MLCNVVQMTMRPRIGYAVTMAKDDENRSGADANRVVVRCDPEDVKFCQEQADLIGVDKSTYIRLVIRQMRVAGMRFMLLPPAAEPQYQGRVVDVPTVFPWRSQPGEFRPDLRGEHRQDIADLVGEASDVLDQPVDYAEEPSGEYSQQAYEPDEVQQLYGEEASVPLPPGQNTDDLVERRLREAQVMHARRSPAPLFVDETDVPRGVISLGGRPKIGQAPVRPR